MDDKTHLLMLDDEPSILQAFNLWLEKEEFLLHTATDKNTAIEIIKKYPVELCLVDLKLGEENGLQVAKELKTLDSLLKIIIITGYPCYESAIDAMKIGVFDYASKSSENSAILKKIQCALEARQKEIAIREDDYGKTQILLVCHHVMIQEGFQSFCADYPDFSMGHSFHSLDFIKPGDFCNHSSILLICSACNPQVLKQPEETIQPLRLLFPRSALVMFNCNPSDDTKKRLIKAGIKGFLPKNISKENMKKSFETILNGQIWVSRKVAHELLNELLEKTVAQKYLEPQNPYNLSNREIEILQAIASGLSNSEISEKLFISEKTVKAHINHLFKKMEVKSRTRAVKKAVEEHIL